jgi:GT2 family glycosyltransferase
MNISISIVNYNTKELLKKCLESIFINLERNLEFEVIVADNNSTDESFRQAKENFPGVKYIENKTNLGFAKATNQTIRLSSARYMLLLNPDTSVLNRAIQKMFLFMEENKDIGILGCKLIMPNNIIHKNCSPFPWLLRVLENPLYLFALPKWIYERIKISRWDYGDIKDVDWILGSCLMVRREVIDKIGMLDERFFIYAEDLEFCYRVKKNNWRITYIPEAEILHYQNVSGIQEFRDKKRLMEYISVQKLFEKYAGKIGLILGFIAHIIGNLVKILFYTLLLIFNWRQRENIRNQLILWLITLIRIIKLGWNAEYPEVNK